MCVCVLLFLIPIMFYKMILIKCLIFFTAIYYASSLKILVFYSIPIRSLNILGEGQVRHLINAGHEVTYVTSFPPKNKPKENYREIDVSALVHEMYTSTSDEVNNIRSISYLMEDGVSRPDVSFFQTFGIMVANITFNNKNLMRFLADPTEKFDVVISDLYESETYAGLSVLYNCPMIWTHSMGPNTPVLRLIDENPNPSYVPDYLSSNNPPFNFFERLEELWTQMMWTVYKRFQTMPDERYIYERTFKPLVEKRGSKLPPYGEVIYNASLIFSNDYPIGGGVPSLPQNFKMIGGFHIKSDVDPLPKDLQNLMDNSENGVIYFSMGSQWQSRDIPKAVIENLLKVFGKLKQTVIWKYEDDLKNLPQNVYIMKWAPQPSILSHPNCKIFISHGGKLSSIESIHYGVPIIGVPIFFDQFININKAVTLGYALKVDLNYDMANNLKTAIETMIADSKYIRKAKELSRIYHDRPVPPGRELVHWVEHVVRTRGASHLRSPALMVPWYQKMYLDLVVVFLFILKLLHLGLKHAKSLVKSKKSKIKSKSKKKN